MRKWYEGNKFIDRFHQYSPLSSYNLSFLIHLLTFPPTLCHFLLTVTFPIAWKLLVARDCSLLRFHDDTQALHNWQCSTGRVISPTRWPLSDSTQHSQVTEILILGRVRTRNLNSLTPADPHVRPGGHWYRLFCNIYIYIYTHTHTHTHTHRYSPFMSTTDCI